MVRRIQALNYRCLRHVDVRLDGNFQVLVGPNASGKSTLMDVIGFFADLARGSIEIAVRQRVPDFRDLVWGRQGNGGRFELALELDTEASSEDSAGNVIRTTWLSATTGTARASIGFRVSRLPHRSPNGGRFRGFPSRWRR